MLNRKLVVCVLVSCMVERERQIRLFAVRGGAMHAREGLGGRPWTVDNGLSSSMIDLAEYTTKINASADQESQSAVWVDSTCSRVEESGREAKSRACPGYVIQSDVIVLEATGRRS